MGVSLLPAAFFRSPLAPRVMPCFRRHCPGGSAEPAVPCCCGVGEPGAFAATGFFHLAGHLGYEFEDTVFGVARLGPWWFCRLPELFTRLLGTTLIAMLMSTPRRANRSLASFVPICGWTTALVVRAYPMRLASSPKERGPGKFLPGPLSFGDDLSLFTWLRTQQRTPLR